MRGASRQVGGARAPVRTDRSAKRGSGREAPRSSSRAPTRVCSTPGSQSSCVRGCPRDWVGRPHVKKNSRYPWAHTRSAPPRFVARPPARCARAPSSARSRRHSHQARPLRWSVAALPHPMAPRPPPADGGCVFGVACPRARRRQTRETRRVAICGDEWLGRARH